VAKRLFHRILVGTDFSETSIVAADLAVELAERFGAELMLVHAYEDPLLAYADYDRVPTGFVKEIEIAARAGTERELERVRKRVPRADALLRVGTPWREVLGAAAETNSDLVVVGTHGRRGLRHVMLGSVAERVVRMANVPVLTVRAAVSASGEGRNHAGASGERRNHAGASGERRNHAGASGERRK
jgi:nucleotide-binding universal stress UspA family protein